MTKPRRLKTDRPQIPNQMETTDGDTGLVILSGTVISAGAGATAAVPGVMDMRGTRTDPMRNHFWEEGEMNDARPDARTQAHAHTHDTVRRSGRERMHTSRSQRVFRRRRFVFKFSFC